MLAFHGVWGQLVKGALMPYQLCLAIVVSLVVKYSTRIIKYAMKVDEALGMEIRSNHCM